MPVSRAARPVLLLAILAILGTTMYPTGWEGAGGLTACVICGGRGLADALLNLMLFLPLGSALAF